MVNLIIGFAYLPFMPFYILGSLSEAVISVWAVVMIVISVLTLIGAFISTKYKLISIKLLLSYLLLLNVAVLFLYWQFGVGNKISENLLSEAYVMHVGFIVHIFVIALLIWCLIQFFPLKRHNK